MVQEHRDAVVGDGARTLRLGGWAMVQEHHDQAGGRWCENTAMR